MNKKNTKTNSSAGQSEEIFSLLEDRFEKNKNRHKGIEWAKVRVRLASDAEKIRSLQEMERTGGGPDVVGRDPKTGEYLFCDCSVESPQGRRSLCYDRKALEARKEFKPKNTAMDLAESMGIEILTEEQYLGLQKLGEFDVKTSSWLRTPPEVRKLGGAIFGDRRFNRVFIYHNGADSYYAARGFRGLLRV